MNGTLSSASSSRKRSASSASLTSALAPSQPRPAKLVSAFVRPRESNFSRAPPLQKFTFTELIIRPSDAGIINGIWFQENADHVKEIDLGIDWQEGERMSQETDGLWTKTGYIGAGFSKRAIYVSHGALLHCLMSTDNNMTGLCEWQRICLHPA